MSNISFNISTTKPKISYDIKLMKTGKSEYSGTFDLSMSDGDQVITPNEGRVFSKVTVKKPDTLVAENIRKDINIGGVVGNLKPYVPVVSSELNVEPKTEIQIFTPSENEYYDKVNVGAVTSSIDSNIVPENIRNNVEILGVKGTMLPQQPDMYQQLVDLNKKLVGLSNNQTITNYDFLANLDTSRCTSFSDAFHNDINLEQVPDDWDTSNVMYFSNCFYFSNDINSSFKKLPNWNYSNGKIFSNFLNRTNKVAEVVLNIPNAESCNSMLSQNYGLTKIHLITSDKLTNISSIFANSNIPSDLIITNTENVKNVSNMFRNSRNIYIIPNFNFKNVIDASSFIYQNISVKKLPNIFGNRVTNFSYSCYAATALKECELDLLSCTNNTAMLHNCKELTNLKLHNIKINTTIGTGTSWGTKLTKESLIFCIKELWSYKDTTTKRTLTMSTPSKTLIADIYVKLITPTQEQIEADPYINNKLPCEVCESTDEGAMTITAYANLKNWTIA